jgi:hypothetical protein
VHLTRRVAARTSDHKPVHAVFRLGKWAHDGRRRGLPRGYRPGPRQPAALANMHGEHKPLLIAARLQSSFPKTWYIGRLGVFFLNATMIIAKNSYHVVGR